MNKEKIIKIYQRRQKAHDELLACDIEIDNMLKSQREEIVEEIKNFKNGAFGRRGGNKKLDDAFPVVNAILTEIINLINEDE